jgi:hypothetical protein
MLAEKCDFQAAASVFRANFKGWQSRVRGPRWWVSGMSEISCGTSETKKQYKCHSNASVNRLQGVTRRI